MLVKIGPIGKLLIVEFFHRTSAGPKGPYGMSQISHLLSRIVIDKNTRLMLIITKILPRLLLKVPIFCHFCMGSFATSTLVLPIESRRLVNRFGYSIPLSIVL
jgi:hypothetical protein